MIRVSVGTDDRARSCSDPKTRGLVQMPGPGRLAKPTGCGAVPSSVESKSLLICNCHQRPAA